MPITGRADVPARARSPADPPHSVKPFLKRQKNDAADAEAIVEAALRSTRMFLKQIAYLTARIDALKARIAAISSEAEMSRPLQTMPGVGSTAARAVEIFAPPMEQFRRGRCFAASCWQFAFGVTLGPVPWPHSSGGKQKLGKTRATRYPASVERAVVCCAVRVSGRPRSPGGGGAT